MSRFIRRDILLGSAGELTLDKIPGAGAAYALRLLSANYTGPAIRVRRSSDNTELDIGFDAAGNLDTLTLLAFTGAGSAYLSAWYDQSGNARHLLQNTDSFRPRIVNGGVLESKNGLPAVSFNGTAHYMTHNRPFLYAAGAATIIAVCSGTAAANNALFSEGHSTLANPVYWPLQKDNTSGATLSSHTRNDANTTLVNSPVGSITAFGAAQTLGVMSVVDTGAGLTNYVNSATNFSGPYTRSGTLTLDGFAVGARFRPTVNGFWAGHMEGGTCYGRALSDGERTAIERDFKSYYGTP